MSAAFNSSGVALRIFSFLTKFQNLAKREENKFCKMSRTRLGACLACFWECATSFDTNSSSFSAGGLPCFCKFASIWAATPRRYFAKGRTDHSGFPSDLLVPSRSYGSRLRGMLGLSTTCAALSSSWTAGPCTLDQDGGPEGSTWKIDGTSTFPPRGLMHCSSSRASGSSIGIVRIRMGSGISNAPLSSPGTAARMSGGVCGLDGSDDCVEVSQPPPDEQRDETSPSRAMGSLEELREDFPEEPPREDPVLELHPAPESVALLSG
mmetsp:Transcript_44260/g.95325  ORF Transcript_44260/g.95325 Transcript_44260/m.95325 type:complete len:265 (+) Transcript_44260:289-1083(+)